LNFHDLILVQVHGMLILPFFLPIILGIWNGLDGKVF